MLARVRWGSALLFLRLAACASPDATVEADPAQTNDVVSTPPSSSSGTSSGGDSTKPGDPPPGTPPASADEPDLVVHAMANLGDSISQGFDADDSKPLDINKVVSDHDSIFHDNPTLSWVQGSDSRIASVFSHYKAKDAKLVSTPISHSGAELVGRSSGLPNLEKQARSIATKKASPDLVYVLLGGNDICNRDPSKTADATANLYSVEEWRAAAVKGLLALEDVLQAGATVRFVSMPRVDLLYSALKNTSVPVIVNSPVGPVTGDSTCKDLWSITAAQGSGICKIVTTEADDGRRKSIGNRIDAYNDALADEVRKMNTDAARNPKKIAFQSDWHGSLDSGAAKNTSVGTFEFLPEHVGKLDCFHPSIAGQKQIATHVLTTANWKP